MDNDGYISNGELFQVLKMMVGSNLKDTQLQQIVDKTILFADKVNLNNSYQCPIALNWRILNLTIRYAKNDKSIIFQDEDGKINFEEFCEVVGNTDIHKKMVVDV